MNKTTKGSLAAGAAAVLLLGGAGSLAYWTSEADVTAGTISSGSLEILAEDPCDDWTYQAGAAGNPTPGAVDLFVPGDLITTTCTFTVEATGDNLRAAIAATDAAYTDNGTSLSLLPETTYEIASATTTRTIEDDDEITSADDGSVITATINVEIPFGTEGDGTGPGAINENDTQNTVDAALGAITIKLTQVDPQTP